MATLRVEDPHKETFYRVRLGKQWVRTNTRRQFYLSDEKPLGGYQTRKRADEAVAAFPGATVEPYETEVMNVHF